MTSALGLVAAALASYLLGHLTYGVSRLVERLLPWRYADGASAREIFLSRNPQARDRPYVHADPGVVRARIDLHSPDSSQEIRRTHASALMLRGSAPALTVGSVVAVVEVFASDEPFLAACAAVLLLGAAGAATSGGWRATIWAQLKALEVAYWIPDIDQLLDDGYRAGESD